MIASLSLPVSSPSVAAHQNTARHGCRHFLHPHVASALSHARFLLSSMSLDAGNGRNENKDKAGPVSVSACDPRAGRDLADPSAPTDLAIGYWTEQKAVADPAFLSTVPKPPLSPAPPTCTSSTSPPHLSPLRQPVVAELSGSDWQEALTALGSAGETVGNSDEDTPREYDNRLEVAADAVERTDDQRSNECSNERTDTRDDALSDSQSQPQPQLVEPELPPTSHGLSVAPSSLPRSPSLLASTTSQFLYSDLRRCSAPLPTILRAGQLSPDESHYTYSPARGEHVIDLAVAASRPRTCSLSGFGDAINVHGSNSNGSNVNTGSNKPFNTANLHSPGRIAHSKMNSAQHRWRRSQNWLINLSSGDSSSSSSSSISTRNSTNSSTPTTSWRHRPVSGISGQPRYYAVNRPSGPTAAADVL